MGQSGLGVWWLRRPTVLVLLLLTILGFMRGHARANPADDWIAQTWGAYGVTSYPESGIGFGYVNCDTRSSIQQTVAGCLGYFGSSDASIFRYDLGVTSNGYLPTSQTGFNDLVAASAHPLSAFGGVIPADFCGVYASTGNLFCEQTEIPPLQAQQKLWLDVSTSGNNLSSSSQPTSIAAQLTLSPNAPTANSKLVATVSASDTTIQEAAQYLGYSGFDWVQNVSYPRAGVSECDSVVCSTVTPIVSTTDSPISDPPKYGWSYCNINSSDFKGGNDCSQDYPYYYPSSVASSDPADYCITYTPNSSGPLVCGTPLLSNGGTVQNFYDSPNDPCLNASLGLPGPAYLLSATLRAKCGNQTADGGLSFITQLVGINLSDTSGSPSYTTLQNGTFAWTDTFNGCSLDPIVCGSGGISIYSSIPADPTTGTGGITLLTAVPEPPSSIILSFSLLCMVACNTIWHGWSTIQTLFKKYVSVARIDSYYYFRAIRTRVLVYVDRFF